MDVDVNEIKLMDLKDGELKLVFTHKVPVSEPDTGIFGYYFSMMNTLSGEEMGTINIRAGYTENIVMYRGDIGYSVFEQFRGNHYSARSCILLVPVIKMLKMNPVWITCNKDNNASRNNIEKIGAEYQDTLTIPCDYLHISFYPEHARVKMRYKWTLK